MKEYQTLYDIKNKEENQIKALFLETVVEPVLLK